MVRRMSLNCANCERPLDGEYCSHCGQPAHEGNAPTLRHFFHDLTHELLHFDGKIVRSLKALLTAPGLLTEEYWSGHIVSWIRPIRLFLVVVALHLISSPGIGPLNYRVVAYRDARGVPSIRATPNPERVLLEKGLQPLSAAENRTALEKFEKTYLAIRYSPPLLFALVSWLFYRRRQPYLVNHLVCGLHFYSFWYLLALVTGLLARWRGEFSGLSLLAGVYLFITLRRLYGQRWFVTLGTTILIFGFLLVVELALGLIAAITAQPRV